MYKFIVVVYHIVSSRQDNKRCNYAISSFILIYFLVNIFSAPSSGGSCRPNEIHCDGQCHPSYIRCNGYPECSDGADEENCPSSPSTTQSPSSVVILLTKQSKCGINN